MVMAKEKTEFAISHGEFPSFDGIEVGSSEYNRLYDWALNWCSAAFSSEQLKSITIEYLTTGAESVINLDLVPAYNFKAVGKISYIRMQGIDILDDTLVFYNKKLAEIRKIASALLQEKMLKAKLTPKPRSPIHDIWYVGNALEDLIDENRFLKTSDGYELLVKYKTRQGLLTAIKERFKEAHGEYLKARTEFSEYFEGVSDKEIDYRLRCYNRILEEVDSVAQNKKASRKKVARRASTERKVKNVAYCQSDSDLKIQSVDPTLIIGAPMLLLYNKKRRRITVLVAADENGLSVKGTTIQNFNSDKSVSKTLRKPEKQISEFRRANRARRVDVILSNIRGKASPASGRLNADTLILKVINN